MRKSLLVVSFLLLSLPARAVEVIALDSKSPLVAIKVMIKAGSAHDPKGLEGLAAMTGELMAAGGFGEEASAVTKEKLAELTRPWGEGAFPQVSVSKEVSVFSFLVPREVFTRYVDEVIAPMLLKPLFDAKELDRLRGETIQALGSSLRLERLEDFGLTALDSLIYQGTSYGHPDAGTLQGLKALKREDVVAFYKSRYRPEDVVVGLSASDPAFAAKLKEAVEALNPEASAVAAQPQPPFTPERRKALIITLPNAGSSGLHAGFPIAVTRAHPDFWPLYVGNIWFGTHRDGFSRLYQLIREERGYNYGDYSYIEHFEGRPENLFPPFNTPRRRQYFSIWVRPIGHAYVPHLMRAITWELEDLLRRGLTQEECAQAKNKAKVLYLSLAETSQRLLAARLDDAFYGQKPGYLESYLKNVGGVSCKDVNAALRRHLKPELLQYLVVTNVAEAEKIAALAVSAEAVRGKSPSDYPAAKPEMLKRDEIWAKAALGLKPEDVRVVPVEKVFETPAL